MDTIEYYKLPIAVVRVLMGKCRQDNSGHPWQWVTIDYSLGETHIEERVRTVEPELDGVMYFSHRSVNGIRFQSYLIDSTPVEEVDQRLIQACLIPCIFKIGTIMSEV